MITRITHLSLFVKSQDDALKFYTEKLGFKVHTDAASNGIRWLTLNPASQPDFEIAIMAAENKEEEDLVGKQGAKKPLICVASNDCKKDYEELSKKGVKFLGAPEQQPWGIAVSFEDLYGNIIYMVEAAK